MENKRKGGAEKIREKKMKLLKKSSENCVKINQCFTPIVTPLCHSDSSKYKFDYKVRYVMKLHIFLFKSLKPMYFYILSTMVKIKIKGNYFFDL